MSFGRPIQDNSFTKQPGAQSKGLSIYKELHPSTAHWMEPSRMPGRYQHPSDSYQVSVKMCP
jgi:hypothetical protein